MSISVTTDISNNTFAVVPFEEVIYWNPRLTRSLQTIDEYDKLETTTRLLENGLIEINYVNNKSEQMFKKVERYRINESEINPYNKSYITIWNNTIEYVSEVDNEEVVSTAMFNHVYLEHRIYYSFTIIPIGIQIGYIKYLKSKMINDFKDLMNVVRTTTNFDDFNYNIAKMNIYIRNPENFAKMVI
jgi:hypothetical protein